MAAAILPLPRRGGGGKKSIYLSLTPTIKSCCNGGGWVHTAAVLTTTETTDYGGGMLYVHYTHVQYCIAGSRVSLLFQAPTRTYGSSEARLEILTWDPGCIRNARYARQPGKKREGRIYVSVQ